MGVSKTNKTYASRYKTDVSVSQTSNTGFDSTTRKLCSGDGADSAISLSDDVLQVQPVNDDTTGTLLIKNKAGSNILVVDTDNSKVLAGASQVAVNTQYAYFGTDYLASSAFAADVHYGIPFKFGESAGILPTMGSSTSSSFNDTNPASSLTLTTGSIYWVGSYWYIPDNITVDAVYWFHAADTATGDVTAAHLMSYVIDTDNGSTSGNLSGGTVVADGATITNAGDEQIYYQSMTVQSADVDAGRVILFTFASDTINSDYTINATVKYHIR